MTFNQLNNEAKEVARNWFMQGRGGRSSCRYFFFSDAEVDEEIIDYKYEFNSNGDRI